MNIECIDCGSPNLRTKNPPLCNPCRMIRWRTKGKTELMASGHYGYCAWCKKPKPEHDQIFCSMKCVSEHARSLRPEANRICRNCGTGFRTNPAYIARRNNSGLYCSRDCYVDYSRSHGRPGVDGAGYLVKNGNRVHRKIMEEYLGRKLDKSEHVHHINRDKTDNRIENLQLMSESEHHSLHSRAMWKKRKNDTVRS